MRNSTARGHLLAEFREKPKIWKGWKRFYAQCVVYRFALKFLCAFAATGLYSISSILKLYCKCYKINGMQCQNTVKHLQLRNLDERWGRLWKWNQVIPGGCFLKLSFTFLLLHSREYLTCIGGREKKKCGKYSLSCTFLLLRKCFVFLSFVVAAKCCLC